MNISLKYKILAFMILLPVLALLVFAYMASDMFLKDKMAYIYETSFKHNISLSDNTKFKFERFTTFMQYNLQTLKANNKIAPIDFISSENSLISLNIFKKSDGKLKLVKQFSRANDFKNSINLRQYQDRFNQLTDKVYIDYESSRESSLKLYLRDQASGHLIEGTFEIASLAQSYKSDKLFYNFLVTKNKSLFIQKNKEKQTIQSINTLKNKGNKKGVFESTDINSIVSYSQISDGVWVVSLLDKNKALNVLDILKTKSALFIIALISLSVILSVVASRTLTGNLRTLSQAAIEIGSGEFETQVDINSNDEVGILAQSFNDMSLQISTLLNELEEYNKTLEQKVEERTFELKQAMDMQNTILDSVDQGFVLLNKDLGVLPVYSKASIDLFDGQPDEQDLSNLLHLKGTQATEIETYFSMAVEEMMPFNDMMMTAPSHFLNNSKKEIFLQYMPVRDDNKKVDKIVLVATDKTDEIEALKNLETQKAKVEMVLKIASNAKAFLSFEKQTFKYITLMSDLLTSGSEIEKDYIARIVHTIKGNAAVYSLKNIVEFSHNYEESLRSSRVDPKELSLYLQNILFSLDEVSQEYAAIIRPGGKSDEGFTLLSSELEKVKQLLDQENSNDKIKNFFDFLSHSEVLGQKLSVLENEAISMSEKLNKKVNVIVKGKDVRVPDQRFDELFSNMIHLIRNAMDHGIEKSDEREKANKSQTATLKISSMLENENYLVVEVHDDGQGINVKKLAEKLEENGIDTSNITQEQMPYMIFHDGISTSDEITDVSGRGVGVSSLKKVVESMYGQITIETNLGIGTKFIIKVPLFDNFDEVDSQAAA